jgi:ribonuclease E
VPAPSLVQPEPVAQPQPQWQPAEEAPPEPVMSAPTPEETAQEADRAAARRRSTVREKVSFASSVQPETALPVSHSAPEPVTSPPPAPAEPAPAATSEAAPRKAGWWSRRFGGGE